MSHLEPAALFLHPHLVERFGRRDPEALGELFDLFAPCMFGFVERVESDPEAADRLMEDVFWALWGSAARVGGDTDVVPLLRAALGLCLRRRVQLPLPRNEPLAEPMILLVDDDAENQETYRMILTHYGFAVIQAFDGDRGVSMARDRRPDLILMDLTMPVLDGLQATRMLKGDPATDAIPVIALTGYATPQNRADAVAAGCHSFLAKPAEPQRLAAEVRRVLAMPHQAPN